MKVATPRRLLETEEAPGVLLAIAPVYGADLQVLAFDLLLERGARASDLGALSRVVADTYGHVHQGGTRRQVPCFLRVDAPFLLDADLPQRMLVLEIPADTPPEAQLIDRLHALARKGQRIAVAGYPAADELLDAAHILRLDVEALGEAGLSEALDAVRDRGLELFVDRLSDPARFRAAAAHGFRYFRGNVLGRPEGSDGQRLDSDRLVLVQLLAELGNAEMSMDSLEAIILRDASLSYKFLKAVNSATYGISKPIETLGYALAILGTVQIRRWAALFLLERHESKPAELVRQMLVRARMCETLAEFEGKANAGAYFTAGLLSRLDELTDIPMSLLLAQVPLQREIKDAILNRAGAMGDVLSEVAEYEEGRFEGLRRVPERAYYEACYRHGTQWARQLQSSLQD